MDNTLTCRAQTTKYTPARTCLHLYDAVYIHTWAYANSNLSSSMNTHTSKCTFSNTHTHSLTNTNRLWNVENRWRPVLFSFCSVHFPLGTSKENICVWHAMKVRGIIHIGDSVMKTDWLFFGLNFCLFIYKEQEKSTAAFTKEKIKVCLRVEEICLRVCLLYSIAFVFFNVLPSVEFGCGRWQHEK